MGDYIGYSTICDYCTILNEGEHTITLENNIKMPVQVIRLKKETIIDSTFMTSFDNKVADTQTLMILSDFDITIEEGVVFTPSVRKKGFVIYCNARLTNKGTISMSARGANAKGEEVLLYDNLDGTFEYVPAIGGTGGETVVSFNSMQTVTGKNGIDGIDVSKRATGGGGSGGAYNNVSGYIYSGKGGTATSYSGGTGGGGCTGRGSTYRAEDGAENGGKGGNAYSSKYSAGYNSGGGAGNPGGLGASATTAQGGPGKDGTGGLLIIYCRIFDNQGMIVSKGSQGGIGTSGGSSGSGSINIFLKEIINEGIIDVASVAYGSGGSGGTGTKTIQYIPFRNQIKNKNLTVNSFSIFMRKYTEQMLSKISLTTFEPYTEEELQSLANEINGVTSLNLDDEEVINNE